MRATTAIVVALGVAVLALALLPLSGDAPPSPSAQAVEPSPTPPATPPGPPPAAPVAPAGGTVRAAQAGTYEYEVLPGLQPGFVGGMDTSWTLRNLDESCGWHTNRGCFSGNTDGDGIDMVMPYVAGSPERATPLQPVYVVFRANTRDPGFNAEVTFAGVDVCKKVKVRVWDGNNDLVAEMHYTHMLPSVHEQDLLNLPTGTSGLAALAFTRVGRVAYGKNDGRVDASLRDASTCGTTGPHLHQWGHTPSGTARVFRNRGNAQRNPSSGILTGDGFPKGYYPDGVEYPMFCSDTVVFTLASSTPAAAATPVRPCPPTGLSARQSVQQLTLEWDDPGDFMVTGYEVRHRLETRPETNWSTWAAASGSHTHELTGLTGGRSYEVELRTVLNNRSDLRSPAIGVTARPLAPCTGTVTASVSPAGGGVVKAGETVVSATGVTLTCGAHELTAEATANYGFEDGWTGCPAGKADGNTCTVTVAETHTGERPLHVGATFTRLQCTVNGKTRPVDIGGTVIGNQTGGSVNAGGSGIASANAPCGEDVTLEPTADADYTFTGWSNCTSVSGTTCTVTTSGLSRSVFATATFTALTATAGDTTIGLAWKIPTVTGALAGYGVRTSTDSGATWGPWQAIASTATTHTLTSLQNGTDYAVQMRVRDAQGWSQPSAKVMATPSVMYTLTGSAGVGGVVTCSEDGDTVECDRAFPEASVVVVMATAAPGYRFRGWEVEVSDQAGRCTPSKVDDSGITATCTVTMNADTTVMALFLALPGTPTGLSVAEAGDSSVTIRWTDPSDSSITKYQYRVKATPDAEGATWDTWTDIPSAGSGASGASAATLTRYTVPNLTNDTLYAIQIRAVNAAGPSGPSAEVRATPEAPECTVTGAHVPADGSLGTVRGGGTVTCGAPVTLRATPASIDTQVQSWSGCTSVSDDKSTCTVTTSASTPSVTATATFEYKRCTVTAFHVPADGSRGRVSGGGTVNCGTGVPLRASRVTNNEVKSWNGGGCSGTGTTCTVPTSGANQNVTVVVGFGAIRCTVTGESNDTSLGTVSPAEPVEVDCGTAVPLTAEAKTNGQLTGWSESGCSGATCTVPTSETVTSKTVTATFEVKKCTVTGAHIPADGSRGTVSGGGEVDCGKDATLTATRVTNNRVASWSGCTSVSENKATCTVTTSGASQSVTATATFEAIRCKVTGEPDDTDRGSVSGSGTVDCGDEVVLTASPSGVGWYFSGWSGCPADGEDGATCTVETSETATTVKVTANFSIRYCSVTVSAGTGGTGGTFGGSGRVQCGTETTIWAEASDGWCFTGWGTPFPAGRASTCLTGRQELKLEPTENLTRTANFKRIQYTLTITISPTGWGAATGAGTYNANSKAKITAAGGICIFGSRTEFSAWSGDLTSTDASTTVTMDGNKSVTATFTLDVNSPCAARSEEEGEGGEDADTGQ